MCVASITDKERDTNFIPEELYSVDNVGNWHPQVSAINFVLHIWWHFCVSAGFFSPQSPYGSGSSWICTNIFPFNKKTNATVFSEFFWQIKQQGLTCLSWMNTNEDVLSWGHRKSMVTHSDHIRMFTQEDLQNQITCVVSHQNCQHKCTTHKTEDGIPTLRPKSIWDPRVYSSFSTLSNKLRELSDPEQRIKIKCCILICELLFCAQNTPQHLTRLGHNSKRRFRIKCVTHSWVSQLHCEILAYITRLSLPHTSKTKQEISAVQNTPAYEPLSLQTLLQTFVILVYQSFLLMCSIN